MTCEHQACMHTGIQAHIHYFNLQRKNLKNTEYINDTLATLYEGSQNVVQIFKYLSSKHGVTKPRPGMMVHA